VVPCGQDTGSMIRMALPLCEGCELARLSWPRRRSRGRLMLPPFTLRIQRAAAASELALEMSAAAYARLPEIFSNRHPPRTQ